MRNTKHNSEQYRRAALALANASKQAHNRSAIFSSASSGEGATTATVYVGRHLLQDVGFNPVVIELNRTRPALSNLFGLDEEKSLAAIASGSASALECVQKDPAGLCMIPAGRFAPDQHVSGLETVLCRATQELQNNYDFILVDAPPILESADVLIAGRIIPNLVLVVGSGRACQETVREACRTLEEANIRLIGTILNERKRILPRWLARR